MKLLTQYIQTLWAVEETVFQRMHELFERHFAGEKIDPSVVASVVADREARKEEIQAERRKIKAGLKADDSADDQVEEDPTDNQNAAYMTDSGVGIVPIMGVIAPHASMVNGMSQPMGTDTGRISKDLVAFADDPKCIGILTDIDSPGGAVTGIETVRAAMDYAKSKKPVHAYTPGMMASAAYWIGCSADKITTARSAFLGSLGVFQVRDDTSAILEKRGVKRHVVRSVPYKGAGVDGTKITEVDIGKWQQEVNALHRILAEDVAADRDIAPDQLQVVADGRIFTGHDSVGLRLADATGTFEQAIAAVEAAGTNVSSSGPGRPAGVNKKTPSGVRFAMTPDELREKHPVAVAQLEAAAVTKHKADNPTPKVPEPEPAASFAQLSEAFSAKEGGKEFIFSAQQKGLSMSAAQKEWSAQIESENAQLKKSAADVAQKGQQAKGAPPVPTFTQTDVSKSKAPDGEYKTYADAVKGIEARDKCKRKVAMARANTEFPQLHEAWREAKFPAIE